MEDVMGHNGVSAILNFTGLRSWVGHYPPDDLETDVEFSEVSAILGGLEDMYGPWGSRAIARRSGWQIFHGLLPEFGRLAGLENLVDGSMPILEKLQIGLPAIAHALDEMSDQETSVQELDDAFVLRIFRCPYCWGRRSDRAICHPVGGFLEEALRWLAGGSTFEVVETRCRALGDEACEFRIGKTPI